MADVSGIRNCFTVDLEDWFQGLTSTNPQIERWPALESRVVAASETLLSILRANRVRATFFVLGYVADHHPQLIEAIAADGHELAVHGYYHRFVSRMTRSEFAGELAAGCAAVERISGIHPQGHRAPYFSINRQTEWAFRVLADHGISYDSSVFPTRNMLYGYPDAPRFPYRVEGTDLVEIPVSTARAGGVVWPFAGGFYMRTLPYSLIRMAIRSLNRQGQAAIMYLHPWELDTGQRYRQVTPRERLTHYHGRRGLAAKLQRLLAEFRFAPMGELVEQLAPQLSSAKTPVRVAHGLGVAPHEQVSS